MMLYYLFPLLPIVSHWDRCRKQSRFGQTARSCERPTRLRFLLFIAPLSHTTFQPISINILTAHYSKSRECRPLAQEILEAFDGSLYIKMGINRFPNDSSTFHSFATHDLLCYFLEDTVHNLDHSSSPRL